eukprot:superscaffoldBa00008168_g23135
MAYRRAINLLPRGKECVFSMLMPPHSSNFISRPVRFHELSSNRCGETTRTLHTGARLMVAKLLSLDELFVKRSLQDYLKKMETEYSECLNVVNSSGTEGERCSDDELRAKRTKVSQLAPLIQSIRELDVKQKEIAETETLLKGGLRHASASISGSQSYKMMKFEAGVHRVQRVPKTEKQGRMHTSTMTVAVLPQPTEISFTINPKDLRIDTMRASGAGGQHVNTTDSAVRIVHLPTGKKNCKHNMLL